MLPRQNVLRCVWILFVLKCFANSSYLHASPYIGSKSAYLHKDLVVLKEWGLLSSSVSAFPVPWRSVSRQLKTIDPSSLAPEPRLALLRLMHHLKMDEQMRSTQIYKLNLFGEDSNVGAPLDAMSNKSNIQLHTQTYFKGWYASLNTVTEFKGSTKILDSVLAYQSEYLNLRIGSFRQMWGPSNLNSLVLSSRDHSSNKIAVSSEGSSVDGSFISWIGDWYASSQLVELEFGKNSQTALMNRFNFSPFYNVEFGISTVYLKDDIPSFSVDYFQSKVVLDSKFSAKLHSTPLSLYFQLSDTDESLFGFASYIFNTRVSLEYGNSINVCAIVSLSEGCQIYNSNGFEETSLSFFSFNNYSAASIDIPLEKGSSVKLELLNASDNLTFRREQDQQSASYKRLTGSYQKPLGNWKIQVGIKLEEYDDFGSQAFASVSYAVF